MKVGRNEPCPCGSGEKYKRCCGQTSTVHRDRLPSLLDNLTSINDPGIQHFLSIAKTSQTALDDPDYWNELGCHLGQAGFKKEAITIFEKTSEIAPNYWSARVNLAGTLSDLEHYDEALAILETIPSGEERHAVMMANVLRATGRYPEAILWYEAAIKEESDFSFAYTLLLDCLENTNSPAYDIWLQRAVQKASDQPVVILRWAKYLFDNERFSELSEYEWIKVLCAKKNRWDKDELRQLLSAEAWRLCAKARLNKSEGALNQALDFIVDIKNPDVCCDQADALAETAAIFGFPNIVEPALFARHPNCHITPTEVYLSHAYRNADRCHEAIEQCEKLLERGENTLQVLEDYWWCLDEIGRTDDAITALESLDALAPKSEQSRIQYNLGFLYSKSGRLGSASDYFGKALDLDNENTWARECLALMKLLDQDFDSADQLMTHHPKSGLFKHLASFARANRNSKSFSADVMEKNLEDYLICSHTRPRSKPFSVKETLHIIEGESTHESIEDFKRYLRAINRGDYSHAVHGLKNQIPSWDWIPDDARAALVEAEHRYQQAESHDHAPTVVSFAKAVEITLKHKIFDEFRDLTATGSHCDELITNATSEPKLTSFSRYMDHRGHLELGGMVLILRLTGGKTGNRVELLAYFKQYINRIGLSILLDSQFLDTCDRLSKLRNPAAHEITCSETEAFQTRGLCLTLLKQLPMAN